MPSGRLQVKVAHSLFRRHLLRVDQAGFRRAPNHNHIVLVDGERCMALPSRDTLLQAIVDLAHLQSHRIEHLHILEHLVAIIETAVQVDLVLDVAD